MDRKPRRSTDSIFSGGLLTVILFRGMLISLATVDVYKRQGVNKISAVIDEENVALGDQKNMVFSGSLVTYGRANVVVLSLIHI